MLKYFNQALAKLGRTQPFDQIAAMAKLALDAGPVLMIDIDPYPTLIGASEDVDQVPDPVLRLACDVGALDGNGIECLTLPLIGTPLPFDAPYQSVVNLVMVGGARRVLCTVFIGEKGLDPKRIARFIAIGRRQVSEHALTQRYRADLKRYITMFDHMERTAKIAIWEYAPTEDELYWSDELYRIHERPVGERLTVREALRYYPEPERSRLRDLLSETQLTGAQTDVTMPFRTHTGRKGTARIIASLQRAPNGEERLAGVFQDVTAAQEATDRLWWTANHDVLTGLPNRALFGDRFRKALERRRRTDTKTCLVLVDVDNFKEVNDTFGHAAGDKLLQLVAQSLKDHVRSNDTVARTGGDEFSILVEDIDSSEGLDAVLARLKTALTVRLKWGEHVTTVSLSAGAAVSPDHGASERDLSHAADLALYRMKDRKGAAVALYDPSLGRAHEERNMLLATARRALEAGHIVPYYQPQIDIASGRVVGVEALARWVTPERVLSAADFEFALQNDELGTQISLAVVDRAIAEIAQLNASLTHKITLSVNASSGEILRRSFIDRLRRLCQARDAGEGLLTVEINEDLVLDDPNGVLAEEMRRAAEEGVRFSLDDFGRYSMITIANMPISELKIDGRFIAGFEGDVAKQTVIRGVIETARALGLRLIVEGVETAEEVRRITELGGRLAQGFFYSVAIPFDELSALIGVAAEPAREEQPTAPPSEVLAALTGPKAPPHGATREAGEGAWRGAINASGPGAGAVDAA